MPDFEVNEGYIEAGRRRADMPLPDRWVDERIPADERVSGDGHVASDSRGAMLESAHPEGVEGSAPGIEPGAGEKSRKLPAETPIVRRTRHLAEGHLSASDAAPARRVGVRLMARRRRLARRACPYGWHVRVLGTPPHRRRHLWTTCHESSITDDDPRISPS